MRKGRKRLPSSDMMSDTIKRVRVKRKEDGKSFDFVPGQVIYLYYENDSIPFLRTQVDKVNRKGDLNLKLDRKIEEKSPNFNVSVEYSGDLIPVTLVDVGYSSFDGLNNYRFAFDSNKWVLFRVRDKLPVPELSDLVMQYANYGVPEQDLRPDAVPLMMRHYGTSNAREVNEYASQLWFLAPDRLDYVRRYAGPDYDNLLRGVNRVASSILRYVNMMDLVIGYRKYILPYQNMRLAPVLFADYPRLDFSDTQEDFVREPQ